jgi:prepilin-type N-terminal cleavage/methylation domain-containing protein
VVASPRNFLAELRLYWVCTLPLLCKPTPFVQRLALKWLGWLPKQCHTRSALGFTLAEILIALAILGVIATFTVPKILVAQQNTSDNAKAKEAATMISTAYQLAQLAGTVGSATKSNDLTPYMNYISTDTSSTIDNTPGLTSAACDSNNICLKLANGGTLFTRNPTGLGFGATGSLNTISFKFDPNGRQDIFTAADGPGKAVQFVLYYNGQLTSLGVVKTSTLDGTTCCWQPGQFPDPSWFSW